MSHSTDTRKLIELRLSASESRLLRSYLQDIAIKEKLIERVVKEYKDFLLQLARDKKIIADNVEDLDFGNGKPFKECDSVAYPFKVARHVGSPFRLAYLCEGDLFSKNNGCGWVIGRPREEVCGSFDPFGLPARKKFFCNICHCLIGGIVLNY